jgi:DNA-binding transcriptional LysR family regulator
VELRHLRYFVAVAEESTLVAAAKRLRIAQPALTRQIHDLEREIGEDLFDRVARGVELTPAGEVCLVSARHILEQVDIAMDRARGASKGIVGRCAINVGARALASGLIARIAARVHADFPGIELVISEGVGFRQWKAIQLGEIDIGLGFPAISDYHGLASETLDYDILDAVIVSSRDELATRASVALTEMKDRTFLAWKSQLVPEYRKQQRVAFANAGYKPTRSREFEDIYAIASMVAAGQGWTLYPSTNPGLTFDGTTVIPLENFRLPLAHAVVSRRGEQRPVVRTVLGLIRRVMNAERVAAGRGPAASRDTPLGMPVVAEELSPSAGERIIELRHLRYFQAVVESSSFGRAAEALDLTQPALSRQIRDLENAVGIPLLERATRGVSATPAGESFVRSTRRILDEADALPAEAQRAKRGTVARCVIGAVSTKAAQVLVSELIRRIAVEQPQIEIIVEDFHTPAQPAAIRAARIDLGLCHASPMSPVEERGVRRDRVQDDVVNCVLVAAGSELAQRESLELHELTEKPFLFIGRSFQPLLYDQLFDVFEGHSFVPHIGQTYDGVKTVWTMVALDRGWCLGFQSHCADPPPGTVAIPVRGFNMPWGLDALSREDESRASILLVLDMLFDIAHPNESKRAVV